MTIESNAGDVSRSIRESSAAIVAALDRALLQAGLLLQARIQTNASGRPGPNVITGNYRRSWNTQVIPGVAVSVGTDQPQGPRLEYGFVGEDSLGRRYNQRPYPHVEPALLSTSDAIDRIIDRTIGDLL